jgi:group II intron reverse transcriptase/maturase
VSLHSIEAKILQTKLNRVEVRSRQDWKAVFNNLGHLINLAMLRECYHSLDGTKAVGINGVTKLMFGRNLDENLKQLLMKIRNGTYQPKASRIVEIPKADGSTRPLAISCFIDKIVQEAVRRILERIYEPIFLDASHGFRPRRNCHSALAALDRALMSSGCGAVLEIDLRKYFNSIPHRHLVRFLKLKISDRRFLYLIIRLLKAPVIDSDGKTKRNEIGSPQGSILSPLVSNLFLNYVLDIWFSWLNDKRYGGGASMVRYADDAAFTFPSLVAAEDFRLQLVARLAVFGISINEAKTRALLNGKWQALRCERLGRRMPTFTFLGFLHVWGVSWNRKGQRFWRVKRRTCPVRYRKKLAEIRDYIKQHRHRKDLLPRMTRVARGYLNYFAINDNERRVRQFTLEVKRTLFKYLNRRSQRRCLKWERLTQILNQVNFPEYIRTRNIFFTSRANLVCR